MFWKGKIILYQWFINIYKIEISLICNFLEWWKLDEIIPTKTKEDVANWNGNLLQKNIYRTGEMCRERLSNYLVRPMIKKVSSFYLNSIY